MGEDDGDFAGPPRRAFKRDRRDAVASQLRRERDAAADLGLPGTFASRESREQKRADQGDFFHAGILLSPGNEREGPKGSLSCSDR